MHYVIYISSLITASRHFRQAVLAWALTYLNIVEIVLQWNSTNAAIKKRCNRDELTCLSMKGWGKKKKEKWLLHLISSLSKLRWHLQVSIRGKTRGEGGRAGKELKISAEVQSNSTSPSVRSYHSEEVRLIVMGGSVLIRVSCADTYVRLTPQ